jgi:hypothetical protein
MCDLWRHEPVLEGKMLSTLFVGDEPGPFRMCLGKISELANLCWKQQQSMPRVENTNEAAVPMHSSRSIVVIEIGAGNVSNSFNFEWNGQSSPAQRKAAMRI